MKHFILKKARSHKYIRRLGAQGRYEYIYQEPSRKQLTKPESFGRPILPIRDVPKSKALSYINNIKNLHKKDYAYSYFQFIMDGETGSPPENPNIGYMGKQAVRIRLDKILNSGEQPSGQAEVDLQRNTTFD